MNANQWPDSDEQEPGIAEVEARPNPTADEQVSRRNLLLAGPLWQYLKQLFHEGEEQGRAFLRGKVAQVNNDARKTAEEAAEIAARAEHELAESVSTAAEGVKKLAEAHKTNAEAEKTKQEALALMLDNLERATKLPESMQAAAMDRLIANSPALSQQVETIQNLLEQLHLRHGLTLLPAPAEESVAVEEGG